MHRSYAPVALHPVLAIIASFILVVGCSAPAPTTQPTADAKPAVTAAPVGTAGPTETVKPAAAAPTAAPKPAAGATAAAAPVAPAGAAKPAAADGPTLVMALDQADVKTLDPGREFEFGAAFVCLNTYDTLVIPKSPTELTTFVPHLAKQWTVSPD